MDTHKVKDKKSEMFLNGANSALYYIARYFGISSKDIRTTDKTVSEKAKLIAQRIQEELEGKELEESGEQNQTPKVEKEDRIKHAHVMVDWLGNCKCSNCEKSIDSTSNYCNWCGAKLDEPESREEWM